MTYRYYFYLFLLIVESGLTMRGYAQPVVRQLTVSDDNRTQYYSYIYDTDGRMLYERSQLEEGGIRTNQAQTEWISSGDTLRIQRKWEWQEGKWVPKQLIRARLFDKKLVSEEYVTLNNQEETVQRHRIMVPENGIETELEYHLEANRLMLKKKTYKLISEQKLTVEKQLFYSADTITGWFITRTVRDSIGRPDSIITDLQFRADSTRELLLTRFFYSNGDSKVQSQVTRKWHPLAGVWQNVQRVDYSYLPDGRIDHETYSYFRELRWLATHRYSFQYYPDGVLKEKVLLGSIYRQWRRLFTVSYTDLSQGYPRSVRSMYNFWGGQTGSNASTDLTFYFNGSQLVRRAHSIDIQYQEPNALDENEVSRVSNELVYPNPSDGNLFLREVGTLILRWEVYDMQGRRLLALQPDYPINRIDLTTLPAGIYLLRVTDNQHRHGMQKITKY